MEEVLKQGYKSELDLFVARAQLDFIARCDGFEAARQIKRHFIPEGFSSPLLNFTDMLEDLLAVGDFGLFQEVKTKYDGQLARDPTFIVVSLMA